MYFCIYLKQTPQSVLSSQKQTNNYTHTIMKKGLLCALTSLLLLLGGQAASAQSTVSITKTNGTVSRYTVQSTGSISFAGDYVVIKESSTSSAQSIPMSAIRNMKFSDSSNGIEDAISGQQPAVSLYPNPAQNYCVVRGTDGEQMNVTVYSMTGAKMIDTTVENEGRIDISPLTTGVYMVKINNHTTKLVKW